MFAIKRVYDAPSPEDGKRYLVDRIWPRGLSKDKAGLDGWVKELAPSTALRQRFHHEPALWEEFKRLYREELATPEAARHLALLRDEARAGRVTLLYAAKDTQHNNAVCLKEILDQTGNEAAPG